MTGLDAVRQIRNGDRLSNIRWETNLTLERSGRSGINVGSNVVRRCDSLRERIQSRHRRPTCSAALLIAINVRPSPGISPNIASNLVFVDARAITFIMQAITRGLTAVKPSHDERSGWNTAARRWFEALDRKAITVGGTRWVAQVVGIHGDLPDLWIQLESRHHTRRSLLLHVTLGTSVDDALAAIAASRDDRALDRIECASIAVQSSTAAL